VLTRFTGQRQHTPFKRAADDVAHRDMDLLNALGVRGWHDQGDVNQLSQCPPVSAQEAESAQSLTARRLDCSYHITGIPARADSQEDIARASKSGDLARKNCLKAVIIACSSQERRIRRECQGR
jgi:hypothetical protein